MKLQLVEENGGEKHVMPILHKQDKEHEEEKAFLAKSAR